MGGGDADFARHQLSIFSVMGAETYVRPLSAYPLALLLIVLFIQFIRDDKRLTWPGAFTPLAAFVLAALAATVIGVLFGPLVLRGQAYWGPPSTPGPRSSLVWLSLSAPFG